MSIGQERRSEELYGRFSLRRHPTKIAEGQLSSLVRELAVVVKLMVQFSVACPTAISLALLYIATCLILINQENKFIPTIFQKVKKYCNRNKNQLLY